MSNYVLVMCWTISELGAVILIANQANHLPFVVNNI